MSVKSELLLNTQNSFQTHAQRGANIVMRGGSKPSKEEKKLEAEIVITKKEIDDLDKKLHSGECSCKYFARNDEYNNEMKNMDALKKKLAQQEAELAAMEKKRSDETRKWADTPERLERARRIAEEGERVIFGGKRKSRRKKGGDDNTVVVENGEPKVVEKKSLLRQIGDAAYKKIRFSGDIDEGGDCRQTGLYGSQCKPGLWCSPVEEHKMDENGETIFDKNGYAIENPRFERTRKFQKNGNCKPIGKTQLFFRGGKRKSKRTKRMARKSRRKSRRNQRGGRGRTITYANLDFMANNRLGKMVPHGDAYTNCNTQTGGGYGFTKEGASASETFKGGYPVFTKYEKSNQCGGKRRRRRKSRKSRKSKRKSRRKSRKSRRKRRKSRRRRRRRGGSPPSCGSPGAEHLSPPHCIQEMGGGQRGGSSHTYGSPVAVGSKPWATAPLGIQANKPSCYDNYNHYKGL